MKRQSVNRLLPAIGFLAIALMLFGRIFLSEEVAVSSSGDDYYLFFSWSYYFASAAKTGILPLWNTLNLCGHPFGTEAPSSFNILNFLTFIFEHGTAYNVWFFFCVLLAGFFTFIYTHSLRVSHVGSFLSGVVFMLSSSVIGQHFHTLSLMIPLTLFALDRAVIGNRKLWAVLAGAFLSIYYLNSNPQYVLYVVVFCLAYAVFRYVASRPAYSKAAFAGIILTFTLFAICISSAQILGTAEIARDSQRQAIDNWYYTLLPTHYITMIFPHFYESPFRGELNFLFGRIWTEIIDRLPSAMGRPFIGQAPYVGIAPLILACLVFVRKRGMANERYFMYSALIVLIYVGTSFITQFAVKHIPMLNQMFQIMRSYAVYEFSLAMLAGFGLDILLQSGDSSVRKAVGGICKALVMIVVAVAAVMAAGHLFLIFLKAPYFTAANEFVEKNIIGNPQYTGSPELYRLRIEQFYRLLSSLTDMRDPSFSRSALIILISVSVFWMINTGRVRKRALQSACIIALVVVDLRLFAPHGIFATPRRSLKPDVPAVEFLVRHQGLARVVPLQDERKDLFIPRPPASLLKPNSNDIYGINSPEGFQSLIMRRYIDVIGEFTRSTDNELTGLIGQFDFYEPRIADLMGIKYVLTSAERLLGTQYKLVYEDDAHRVYENMRAYPRAFIVHNYLVCGNEQLAFAALKDDGVSLRDTVILEDEPRLKCRDFAESPVPDITRYSPHEVDIDVDMKADGYLVLSDSYFPGWEVYVNGKEDKIYRADYIFRAVELREGKHRVSFVYKPRSVRAGLSLAGIGLVCAAAIAFGERR